MQEKTDRRILYTRAVIKDAFLSLIARGGWSRLSVTLLCRKADIARATFYLHYPNLDAVLTDVLADAFQTRGDGRSTFLRRLQQTAAESMLTDAGFLPLCQRAADDKKYRPLFLDRDLTPSILSFLYKEARDTMVPAIMESASISRREAEILFLFLLHGSFAVNTALGWKKDSEWYAMQEMILRFKLGGIASLGRKNRPAGTAHAEK